MELGMQEKRSKQAERQRGRNTGASGLVGGNPTRQSTPLAACHVAKTPPLPVLLRNLKYYDAGLACLKTRPSSYIFLNMLSLVRRSFLSFLAQTVSYCNRMQYGGLVRCLIVHWSGLCFRGCAANEDMASTATHPWTLHGRGFGVLASPTHSGGKNTYGYG